MICDKYRSKKCPARLNFEVDENNTERHFVLIKNHNHAKPKVEYLIHQFKNEFKKEITTSLTKPCIIYGKLCLRFVLLSVQDIKFRKSTYFIFLYKT